MMDAIEQRHQNILRWAANLARDCNDIENKIKYNRPGKSRFVSKQFMR